MDKCEMRGGGSWGGGCEGSPNSGCPITNSPRLLLETYCGASISVNYGRGPNSSHCSDPKTFENSGATSLYPFPEKLGVTPHTRPLSFPNQSGELHATYRTHTHSEEIIRLRSPVPPPLRPHPFPKRSTPTDGIPPFPPPSLCLISTYSASRALQNTCRSTLPLCPAHTHIYSCVSELARGLYIVCCYLLGLRALNYYSITCKLLFSHRPKLIYTAGGWRERGRGGGRRRGLGGRVC